MSGADRLRVAAVDHAVAARRDHLAVLHDGHGHAGDARLLHHAFGQAFDFLGLRGEVGRPCRPRAPAQATSADAKANEAERRRVGRRPGGLAFLRGMTDVCLRNRVILARQPRGGLNKGEMKDDDFARAGRGRGHWPVLGRGYLQRPGHRPQRLQERLRPDRRAADAPLRPDPEPGRGGQGLPQARARDARGRDPGARRRRQRPGGRQGQPGRPVGDGRAGQRREPAWPARWRGCWWWPRPTRT